MFRVVDFSDYQAGLNLDVVASAVDAAWAKAGDWSYIRAYGWPGDDVHNPAIARFAQLGKPIGSYLFVRPGWTNPQTQIDAWAAHVPAGWNVSPMIDLEVPGTLSGGSLTAWVDEALYWAANRFGVVPTLYWSRRFQSDNGMGMPASPHLPMVAEYHRGYSPFNWADVAGWQQRAYSAFGGPDVPVGYNLNPTDLIWQFTSSAQIPGFPGLVDCSFVPESLWAPLAGGGSLGPASPPTSEENELNDTEKQQLSELHQWLRPDLAGRTHPDGSPVTYIPELLDMLSMENLTDIANLVKSDGDHTRGDIGNFVGAFYTRTDQLDGKLSGEIAQVGGGGATRRWRRNSTRSPRWCRTSAPSDPARTRCCGKRRSTN